MVNPGGIQVEKLGQFNKITDANQNIVEETDQTPVWILRQDAWLQKLTLKKSNITQAGAGFSFRDLAHDSCIESWVRLTLDIVFSNLQLSTDDGEILFSVSSRG